jgi:hypothetical protein
MFVFVAGLLLFPNSNFIAPSIVSHQKNLFIEKTL